MGTARPGLVLAHAAQRMLLLLLVPRGEDPEPAPGRKTPNSGLRREKGRDWEQQCLLLSKLTHGEVFKLTPFLSMFLVGF